MAPAMADLAVVTAASKLIVAVQQAQGATNNHPVVVQESQHCVKCLSENIALLRKQLPNKKSVALASLEKDLLASASYLEARLKDGSFQRVWDANKSKGQLEALRRNVLNQVQVKLFIINLEAATDASRKVEGFESRMLELSPLGKKKDPRAIADIRTLLQPLVLEFDRQDQSMQAFLSTARQNLSQVETSKETQDFVEYVLSNLEAALAENSAPNKLTAAVPDGREEYVDPLTKDLMIDPVKCNDGVTYDRFAVFEHNLHAQGTAQLVIVCDDESVRRSLFRKFPEENVESKFHLQRQLYREEALKLAGTGQHADAAASMLDNVLQWAPFDGECRAKRDELQLGLEDTKNVLRGSYRAAPPVITPLVPAPEQAAPGVLQVTVTAEIRSAEKVNWNRVELVAKHVAKYAAGLVVLIVCFPFSCYYLPVLFPTGCKGDCCGDSTPATGTSGRTPATSMSGHTPATSMSGHTPAGSMSGHTPAGSMRAPTPLGSMRSPHNSMRGSSTPTRSAPTMPPGYP